MDKLEYHAVIKFFVLDGLTSQEIHSNVMKLRIRQLNLSRAVRQTKMAHVKRRQRLISHEKLCAFAEFCKLIKANAQTSCTEMFGPSQ